MPDETAQADKIPQALVEYILLGSGDSRRHMQDSPILGDVWIAYARNPNEPIDLLITSHKDTTANDLAAEIFLQLRDLRNSAGRDDPRVAAVARSTRAHPRKDRPSRHRHRTGNPNTRCAMMLRWISDVPPAMVPAYVVMYRPNQLAV